MKIANSSLALSASHVLSQQREVSLSMTVTVGQRSASTEEASHRASHSQALFYQESASASTNSLNQAVSNDDSSDIDQDPRLSLIRRVIEILTGHRIRVFDAQDMQTTPENTSSSANPSTQPTAANLPTSGFGIAYDFHASYREIEQTSFSASGAVRTEDGREISFNLNLTMSRSYFEESDVSIRLGAAAKATDPLVLNFAGTAAQLTDQRFSFDLNADGQQEQINFVSPGSGFLVFDRNADGLVNNGQELFGPTTGDGFRELATFDSDGNQWIDENDAIYDQLKVWTRNAQGQDSLQSLRQANVGAISLTHVATPFSIKNDQNELQAQVRSSGTFLQEDGNAGTIQQIDLTA